MKIYIFCDLEGISGVSGKAYIATSENRPDLIAAAKKFMAHDINACIAGCARAGANEIVVRDGHGAGLNLTLDQIDPRASLVSGATPGVRFGSLDGSDALILLGYHAMAGTPKAVLEHTYSSANIQNVWLNDRKVGEIGLDAAIAAEHNVPVIMVSGDDKTCAEAEAWLPGVVTCTVKKAFSLNGAELFPLTTTRQLIEDKTVAAIEQLRRHEAPQLKVDYPATYRLELVERGQLPLWPRANMRLIDGHTYEVSGDSIEALLLGNC